MLCSNLRESTRLIDTETVLTRKLFVANVSILIFKSHSAPTQLETFVTFGFLFHLINQQQFHITALYTPQKNQLTNYDQLSELIVMFLHQYSYFNTLIALVRLNSLKSFLCIHKYKVSTLSSLKWVWRSFNKVVNVEFSKCLESKYNDWINCPFVWISRNLFFKKIAVNLIIE